MDVNEHDRLFNFILGHKLQEQHFGHNRVFNNEHKS
jgi:hypothetical protein